MLTLVNAILVTCLALYACIPSVALALVGAAAPRAVAPSRFEHSEGRAGAEGYWRVTLADLDYFPGAPAFAFVQRAGLRVRPARALPLAVASTPRRNVEATAHACDVYAALDALAASDAARDAATGAASTPRSAPVRRPATAVVGVWRRPLLRGTGGRFTLAPTHGTRVARE